MRNRMKRWIAVLMVLALTVGYIPPQTVTANTNKIPVGWQTVGNAGFSAGEADYTSMYVYNGTHYVAYSDAGNSNKATEMKFVQPLGSLADLTMTGTIATLQWQKASDDVSQQSKLQSQVYRSESNNLETVFQVENKGTASGIYNTTPVATVTSTSTDITGLTNNTKYYFVVTAVNESGEGSVSEEVSAMPEVQVDKITVGSAEGKPGDTVSVDVAISPIEDCGMYDIILHYDQDVLELAQESVVTDALNVTPFNYDIEQEGRIRVQAGFDQPVKGAMKAFTVAFRIKDNATAGDSAVTVEQGQSFFFGVFSTTPIMTTAVNGKVTVNASQANKFKVGDYVKFGKYNNVSILWRVISLDADGDPMLFSEDIIALKAYDSAGSNRPYTNQTTDPSKPWINAADRLGQGSNNWEFSNIRQWLNSSDTSLNWLQNAPSSQNLWEGYNPYDTEKGFLAEGNFTEKQRSLLKQVTHKTLLHVMDENLKDGGEGDQIFNPSIADVVQNYDEARYEVVQDKMFLLSVQELKELVYDNEIDYKKKPTLQAISNNTYNTNPDISAANYWWYWTRTPSAGSTEHAQGSSDRVRRVEGYVQEEESVGKDAHAYRGSGGIAPACVLDLNSDSNILGSGTEGDPFIIEEEPTYTIEAIENEILNALTSGYASGAQETKNIAVTRTGNSNLNNLSVALSGVNADSFKVTELSAPDLNSTTTTATFTVKAKDGLAAGTYTATVTISADNMTAVTFTVTQVVSAIGHYTVDFDSKGGSEVSSITGVVSGSAIGVPTTPTKSGYTFGGWYQEETCQNAWDFVNDIVTADITLYAYWIEAPTATTYTVTFNTKGGSDIAQQVGVVSGSAITIPTAPTKSGYTFGGWYQEAAYTQLWNFTDNKITMDITLYALWIINTPGGSTPGGNTPGGSTPGNTNPAPTTDTKIIVDIKQGDTENTVTQITIARNSNEAGVITDTITYQQEDAAKTVQELKMDGEKVARIVIPDFEEEIAETKVVIQSASIEELAKGEIDLHIDSEEVKVDISKESLANISSTTEEDLYFRLILVKEELSKQEIEKRAVLEVGIVSGKTNGSITVLANPITIETNMSSTEADITLPLTGISLSTDKKEREAFLQQLAVYIEHSDGDKELVQGELIEYKAGVYGIRFHIKKFSTFTLVKTDAYINYSANDITKIITPSKAAIKGTKITANVAHQVSSITVKVTVSDKAVWELYSDKACTKAITNHKLTLKVGSNQTYIKVTAQDGAEKIYAMTVTRSKSSEAEITKVTIPFKATIKERTITAIVVEETASVKVKVSVSKDAIWKLYSDKACTKKISSNKMKLIAGVNTAYIKVTAQDKKTNTIYTLRITRKEEQYKAHIKLGLIGNKNYAEKVAGIFVQNYKGSNVEIKSEGKYYRVYVGFTDKAAATKACEEMIDKKYIINYSLY